jgi:type IV secretory pathway VirB3-like protein
MLVAIVIIAVVFMAVIVYEFFAVNRMLDESESRIIRMLNKAIDNVNVFFVGLFTGLWGSSDHDDDELTD